MTASVDGVRERLRAAGARRARAEKDRGKAMTEIAELVRAGVKLGMEKKEIAELAGVTRNTVYALLEPPE